MRLCHFQKILVFVGLLLAGVRGGAQGFDLSATVSTNVLSVSNSLTYSIVVTNRTGLVLNNVQVTNTLSSSVILISATNSQGTNIIVSSNLVFQLGFMGLNGSAQMAVTVQPTSAGLLTNSIIVVDPSITNSASTNLITQVVSGQADLGVAVFGPLQTVITNDLTSYWVSVTNFGPDAAPNVILTNTLPAGVNLNGASRSFSTSGSNQMFNLGTLPSGSNATVQLFIQPTNVATPTFSASVGAAGLLDPNLTNNTASTNIPVLAYLPGTILAVTNSGQTTDLQNGLTEQSVLLTNTGTNDAPAVRLVVSGLTKRLANAVGTNGSSPFVIYYGGAGVSLASGQSVTLLLQYFPRGSFAFTNGQLHAYAVPPPNWTPPAVSSTSTNLNISRIVKLDDGRMLIEFPTGTNRIYTVAYSDNAQFSNAMIAPPSIAPSANRTQWIDYGPPTTTDAPTNTAARFYRVFQNP